MTHENSHVGLLDNTGKPLPRMADVIRPGANAIIFNENREVLLEKRSDNGFWGLPGGGIDIGESLEQGAIREVFEETGLRVRVKRMIGIYSDPRKYNIACYPNGDVVQYVTVSFECEYLSGELRLSDESTDMRYFPADALPDNLLLSHAIRIQDALANQVEPFIK